MNRWPLLALALLGVACTRKAPPASEPAPVPIEPVPVQAPELPQPEPAPPPAPVAEPAAPRGAELRLEVDAPVADGKLTQEPGESPGTCKVSYFSRRTQQVVWTSSRCLGTRTDALFVAGDGRRVLTLHPSIGGAGWQRDPAAEVTRAGEPVAQVSAQAVLAGNDGLSPNRGQLVWVHGLAGAPGDGPELTSDGDAVVFTRIDGQMMRLDFDGHLALVEIREAPAAADAGASDAGAEPTPAPPKAASSPRPPRPEDPGAAARREEACRLYGRCGSNSTLAPDSPENQIPDSRNTGVLSRDQNQISTQQLEQR